MELQTIYLHSAIVICGFLTGISSESKETQDTDPFDKDHYDKEHPLVISATHISIDSITIGWEMPENMANYTSQLNNFVVYYHKRAQKGNYTIATVSANASSYMIGNLDAGTRYSLYVAANYSTGQDLASHTFIYKTLGYGGPANPCTCHHLGSKDNNCDPMTGKCTCKGEGYVDLRCEKCKPTYYWHTRLACQKCPNCNLNNSNGSCYVDRGCQLKDKPEQKDGLMNSDLCIWDDGHLRNHPTLLRSRMYRKNTTRTEIYCQIQVLLYGIIHRLSSLSSKLDKMKFRCVCQICCISD